MSLIEISEEDARVAIANCSTLLRRAPAITIEQIQSGTTATNFKQAKEVIKSNDISGFYVCEYPTYLLISGLVHRKKYAQVHFVTKVHLPLESLSTSIEFLCACQFNSVVWCSHVTALMLLASHLQLSPFIQPNYDEKSWRPKQTHPFMKLAFVREQTLPWWRRVYLLMSRNPLNAPERRHASLASERVVQTYMLQKEPKKRTRSSAPQQRPAQQTKTSSWSAALQRLLEPISTVIHEVSIPVVAEIPILPPIPTVPTPTETPQRGPTIDPAIVVNSDTAQPTSTIQLLQRWLTSRQQQSQED